MEIWLLCGIIKIEMSFKSYDALSSEASFQIKGVVDIWHDYLKNTLVGVYLHGSIALGYFSEGTSDIDILIVTNRRIPGDERLSIAEKIIALDGKPSPLEMSAIYEKDLKPWKYPPACQFHYSDAWTERYKQLLNGRIKENFLVDTDFTDKDIACHVHLTNQCGICAYGKPIGEVFPAVPENDFWDSISAEVTQYDFHAYHPRFFASNILTLGRILSYKCKKRILSKYEAASWTIAHVPERFRYIIENAVKSWYFGKTMAAYKREDLEDLGQLLVKEIIG